MYHRLCSMLAPLMAGVPLLLLSLPVRADDDLQWNGFLNVVGGFSRHETADLQNPRGTFNSGFGYDQDLTFDHETSAGLQATKPLDEQTEVTAQLYARGSEQNYQAKMKWLYLTWQPDEYSRFRIGRIGTPTYHYSDFLNVGYAYHWITPPQWVYLFDTTVTGVDYTFEDTWRDVAWSVEVAVGTQNEYLPPVETDFQTENARGILFSVSKGEWLSGRFAYFRGLAAFQFQTISAENVVHNGFDALAEAGSLTQDQANQLKNDLSAGVEPYVEDVLQLEGERLEYKDFALRVDKDRWFAMYETTRFTTDTYLFNTSKAWFLTSGVRIGQILWHLTYAEIEVGLNDQAQADEAIVTAGPASLDPAVLTDFYGRSFRLASAYPFANEFREWTLGSAIELNSNTLLKFETTYSEQLPMGVLDVAGVGYNALFKAAVNVSF